MSSKKYILPDKLHNDPQSKDAPEPIFLNEDQVHYKGRTPYILILILIVVILSSFWKMFMVEKRRASEEGVETSVKKVPIERMVGGGR